MKALDRNIVLGYISAFGSAVSYGIVTLVAQKIINDYFPPVVASAFSIIFGMLILGFLFIKDIFKDFQKISFKSLMWVLLAGVSGAWGVTFWVIALNNGPIVIVAPISATFPLVSLVLTFVFLKKIERLTFRIVLGSVFVVLGVVIIASMNN